MGKKHAYLILGHKSDLTFHTLLRMLDDGRNDIFVHMDAKNTRYDAAETERLLKKSAVYHAVRTSVYWGGYSLINAELLLLDLSMRTSEGEYAYYHLLSGQDLPIKSQDYIHDFFARSAGREFVSFSVRREGEPFCETKTRFYHMADVLNCGSGLGRILNRISWGLQKAVGVKRHKDTAFKMGSQWFSITEPFARYVLSQRDWIERTFARTIACDEVFLQTLLAGSEFAANQYQGGALRANMRLIDFERVGNPNHPYVFRLSDYDALKSSDMLFARKFDAGVDSEIIKRVAETFGSQYVKTGG